MPSIDVHTRSVEMEDYLNDYSYVTLIAVQLFYTHFL